MVRAFVVAGVLVASPAIASAQARCTSDANQVVTRIYQQILERAPDANAAGLLLVSQGSTASSLAIPGDALYRMVPTDKVESRATVDLMAKQERNYLVTIGRDDAGNQGLITSVTAGVPSSVTVATPSITYPATSTVDTAPIVSAVQSALASTGAQAGRQPAIYLAGFGEVSSILAALGGANLASDVVIYGGDEIGRAHV